MQNVEHATETFEGIRFCFLGGGQRSSASLGGEF